MELKTEFKQTSVGAVPAEWPLEQLHRFAGFITKGATPTTYGYKWVPDGILFLRSECVSENGLDLSQSMFISAEAHSALSRGEVRSGDLLVTITGNVGRAVLLGDDFGIGNINQHIARVRINSPQLDSRYALHFLSQPQVRRYYESITTGQAYPQISLRQVRETEIPLPSVKEQRAIAAALSDVDALLAALDQLIAKKRAVKTAAMQQLLTGRQRLPGFSGAWETMTYAEVLYRKNTRLHKIQSHQYASYGRYPVVDQGQNLIAGYTDIKDVVIESPDGGLIVFGDHTRAVKFVNFDFVVGADGTQVLGTHDGYVTEFIYYQLASTDIPSTGYNRHFKFIKEMEFNVPSEEEQKAITKVLSDMDAEIAALEARRAKTTQIKRGMMQELLTGRTRLVTPDADPRDGSAAEGAEDRAEVAA